MDRDIILDLFEQDLTRLPKKAVKFLRKERAPSSDEQTLSYFAYGYAAAFEELAVEVIRWWPRRDYLWLPACFLGRHSMELAMKRTINYASDYTGLQDRPAGHGLLQLWDRLIKQVEAVGYATNDEWSVHCLRLINHIHEHDPGGERFRYPASINGQPFPFTRGEFEGFVNAHSHITGYCDALRTELSESFTRS